MCNILLPEIILYATTLDCLPIEPFKEMEALVQGMDGHTHLGSRYKSYWQCCAEMYENGVGIVGPLLNGGWNVSNYHINIKDDWKHGN
jgi:hypothetical protein